MAKKYDRRTKEGKAAAKAEADIAMLGEVFNWVLVPIKFLLGLIFKLIMKIFKKQYD